jgi:hypothetical protein
MKNVTTSEVRGAARDLAHALARKIGVELERSNIADRVQ